MANLWYAKAHFSFVFVNFAAEINNVSHTSGRGWGGKSTVDAGVRGKLSDYYFLYGTTET